MIEITPALFINEDEIVFKYIRASGPGGQNVNKVATAAQLRFDVRSTTSLPAEVKERLKKLAGSRMTQDGILVIEAKRYRAQERNRLDATRRLVKLIQKTLVRPKRRRKTMPSATSRAKRVEAKKQRGGIKRMRRPVSKFDE